MREEKDDKLDLVLVSKIQVGFLRLFLANFQEVLLGTKLAVLFLAIPLAIVANYCHFGNRLIEDELESVKRAQIMLGMVTAQMFQMTNIRQGSAQHLSLLINPQFSALGFVLRILDVVQANSNLEDQSQVFTSTSATYDGHGGPEASRFVNRHLFPCLCKFLTEHGGLSAEVIKKAFSATEQDFTHLVKRSLQIKPQIASVGLCCLVGEFSTEHGGLSAEVIKKAFSATEQDFTHLVKRSLQIKPQIASVLNMEGPYSNDDIEDVRRRWAECFFEVINV